MLYFGLGDINHEKSQINSYFVYDRSRGMPEGHGTSCTTADRKYPDAGCVCRRLAYRCRTFTTQQLGYFDSKFHLVIGDSKRSSIAHIHTESLYQE